MPLAVSLERAVTDAALLLLGAGALLAFAFGLLQRRLGLLRWPLLVITVGSIGVGTALGAWAWHEKRPRTVRGSATKEFVDVGPKRQKLKGDPLHEEQWPTYGYDVQRTHVAPNWRLRPPFHRIWQLRTGDIEFPPSIAYDRVYVAQQRGRFFALDARSGKLKWTHTMANCAAASPTIADGVVYQGFMHRLPCGKHQAGARGFVIAWHARNGRRLWRFDAGAVESSPLLVGRRLYFGSWDHKLYALDLRGRRRPTLRWTFRADDEIVAAPSYHAGTVYIATSGGSLYAVWARSGRLRWQAHSFSRFGRREYFYATPTLAYGRVFVGNADGTVYAFGASTGHLLWARQVGTYVYTAAAVWRKTVYVGTWDGVFAALDARTGDIRWRFDAPSTISGAPTILAGLVYFATCGTCGQGGLRRVKIGPRGTFALDARNGKLVWRFSDGRYSPVVADERRVYIAGKNKVYALITKRRWLKLKKLQAEAKRAHKRRAGRRARHR